MPSKMFHYKLTNVCPHSMVYTKCHSKVLWIYYHLHISFISEHTVLVHTPTELYEYCIISLSTISYYYKQCMYCTDS